MNGEHLESQIDRFGDIVSSPSVSAETGRVLGPSREGRPVRGYRIGEGPRRVSLLGGCHADEPVGPRFLRHLVSYLASRADDDPLLARRQWWVVPHINPDGAVRNRPWSGHLLEEEEAYRRRPDAGFDLPTYLRHVERERPPDDVEFGFPEGPDDEGARPENRAAYEWWRAADGPFDLHASLHGMAAGWGPWFLLEEAWRGRVGTLKERCRGRTHAMGYRLHDEDRKGDKGFERLERGFTTRPDSRAMRRHFLEEGDEETAAPFRPSSMEAVRSLGGDPLTVVSEMPLFLVPEASATERDPTAPWSPGLAWKERLTGWARALRTGSLSDEEVRRKARAAGVRPMPVRDQMELQWTLVVAGLEQVELVRRGDASGVRTEGPSPAGEA